MRRARERALQAGVSVEFAVADVLEDRGKLPRADVVFERGVLHTFNDQEGRLAFAGAVADLLDPDGLWLDVSGSADTPDEADVASSNGWPRLTVASIVAAAEPLSEVLCVRRSAYGETPGRTDFLAFASVLRRR